jgi:hypothetical protein
MAMQQQIVANQMSSNQMSSSQMSSNHTASNEQIPQETPRMRITEEITRRSSQRKRSGRNRTSAKMDTRKV